MRCRHGTHQTLTPSRPVPASAPLRSSSEPSPRTGLFGLGWPVAFPCAVFLLWCLRCCAVPARVPCSSHSYVAALRSDTIQPLLLGPCVTFHTLDSLPPTIPKRGGVVSPPTQPRRHKRVQAKPPLTSAELDLEIGIVSRRVASFPRCLSSSRWLDLPFPFHTHLQHTAHNGCQQPRETVNLSLTKNIRTFPALRFCFFSSFHRPSDCPAAPVIRSFLPRPEYSPVIDLWPAILPLALLRDGKETFGDGADDTALRFTELPKRPTRQTLGAEGETIPRAEIIQMEDGNSTRIPEP